MFLFSLKTCDPKIVQPEPIWCAKLWKDFPKLKELVFQGTPPQEGSALYIWQEAHLNGGNSFNWINVYVLQSPNSTQKSCWRSGSLCWSYNCPGLKIQVLELLLHVPLMAPLTSGYCDKYRSIGQVNSRYRHHTCGAGSAIGIILAGANFRCHHKTLY